MVLTKKKEQSPIFIIELINFFIQIHFYNIFITFFIQIQQYFFITFFVKNFFKENAQFALPGCVGHLFAEKAPVHCRNIVPLGLWASYKQKT